MPEPARRVSLVRAGSSRESVTDAVERALALIGSPLDELHAGMRVLIKPNMFQLKAGFQSDPEVVTAVARLAAARGASVIVAERTQQLHALLRDSDVHRYATVRSLDDCPLRVTQIDSATSLRVPLAIPDIVLDCDYFIGVPQLRTHASVLFSNAMKNLVGLLPGYTTRIVHMAGVDESTVDLNLLRPQHLVVCDATTVIEGNYPMGGTARRVGLIAAADNAVAADAVLGTVAGFDVREARYLVDAHARGLGPLDPAQIDVRGEEIASVAFAMRPAAREIVAPRPGIHVYADTACDACKRYLAGALHELGDELRAWDGEMTVIAGPLVDLPPLRGAVVLVGNCLYECRDAGVYIEGCPPRAIQLAAFRYAMGEAVTDAERTQFRVPAAPARSAA